MLSAIPWGVASGTNPIPRRFSKTKDSQSSPIILSFITLLTRNGESGVITGFAGNISSFMAVVLSILSLDVEFLSMDLINCAIFSSESDELSLDIVLPVVDCWEDVVVFSSSDDVDDDELSDLLDSVVDLEVDDAVVSSFDFLYSLDTESDLLDSEYFFLDSFLSASSFAFWAVFKS